MFSIQFDTENDAFQDCTGLEIGRILHECAEKTLTSDLEGEEIIRDINGNKIGTMTFTKD